MLYPACSKKGSTILTSKLTLRNQISLCKDTAPTSFTCVHCSCPWLSHVHSTQLVAASNHYSLAHLPIIPVHLKRFDAEQLGSAFTSSPRNNFSGTDPWWKTLTSYMSAYLETFGNSSILRYLRLWMLPLRLELTLMASFLIVIVGGAEISSRYAGTW